MHKEFLQVFNKQILSVMRQKQHDVYEAGD